MKRVSLILSVALVLLTISANAQIKKNIHIIATGGTIAGSGTSATSSAYRPGNIAIERLIEAVPQIKDIANITGEQLVNIGSEDMTDAVWLSLAKRINELLSKDSVDGVVVTHGTDTMEETAYFLSLVVKSGKPIVLTGAMRASTAMSADGPLNLYNAVITASSESSKSRGVIVAMNSELHNAREVTKTNTSSVETFDSPNSGAIGDVINSKPYYNIVTLSPHTQNSEFEVAKLNKLPKVAILYGHSNVEGDMIESLIKNGYKGIVYAGVGNGNIHKNVLPYIEKAINSGIVVVRSSRVVSGATTSEVSMNDDKYHFVVSGNLNPQKARVLLQLSLTKSDNWKEIQQLFSKY